MLGCWVGVGFGGFCCLSLVVVGVGVECYQKAAEEKQKEALEQLLKTVNELKRASPPSFDQASIKDEATSQGDVDSANAVVKNVDSIEIVNVEEIKMILEQQNTGHDLAKGNMARQTQSPANLEELGLPLPMNNWSH